MILIIPISTLNLMFSLRNLVGKSNLAICKFLTLSKHSRVLFVLLHATWEHEPGCFFARHRDSERLDGMFATLVLELPSIYEGAELSVYSPLTPGEKETYTFNGGGNAMSNTKRRSNRLRSPGLHFAAFYADCYHEVSKLTSGHRVALVYHLTANPRAHRILPHLPVPSPSPPQPADESIARRLSKLVEMFSNENDDAYPNEISCDGKPKKLVVVLYFIL